MWNHIMFTCICILCRNCHGLILETAEYPKCHMPYSASEIHLDGFSRQSQREYLCAFDEIISISSYYLGGQLYLNPTAYEYL
ncbi:hypothetical protein EV426DRAFT_399646 [Tirmania nivea]|nr:hypothetical protein EV426DRAFT_399646 [Tirmania nivea]